MAIRIGQNIESLTAQRRLNDSSQALSKSFERLSSGLRINSASDDAAGLAVSQDLKASTRVYSQAIRNISDGFSYLAIGEGALKELTDITTRQIELAEQAANGVYSLSQRRAINTEANALADEFNRIVQSTKFNGRNILDTTQNSGDLLLQAGYGASGTLQIGVGETLSRTVGDGSFGAALSYQTQGVTNAMAMADINGDGSVDLVTAGNGGFARVRLGNGDGTFGAGTNYRMDGSVTYGLSLADLDGNGILDLISAGNDGVDGYTAVRLGNGDGTFKAALSYKMTDGNATAVSVVDVDANGILDIVTTGLDGGIGYASIRLGNGDGSFKAESLYRAESSYSYDVSLADLDGNGTLDLVTAGHAAGVAYSTVRLGNGDGSFGTAVSYRADGSRLNAVVLDDINGDGIIDIVAAGYNSSGGGFAGISLGNGNGTFQAMTSVLMDGTESSAISLSDIDGDGILDIVTAGSSGGVGSATIRLGNGNGTFKGSSSIQMEATASNAVSVVDINKDGALDVVTAGESAGAGWATMRLGDPIQVTTMPKLDLLSQKDARTALDYLKGQLSRISAELGSIGSFESRLSVASNVLQVSRENYLAANSRIEDVDVAAESSSLVRTQILQQAASAVLAQANLGPSLVLKLL